MRTEADLRSEHAHPARGSPRLSLTGVSSVRLESETQGCGAGARLVAVPHPQVVPDVSKRIVTALPTPDRLAQWLRGVLRTLGSVLYGMTVYDWVRELEKSRAEQERLFMVIVYGDLLGIPILPPYYSLRLLPFIVEPSRNWRRSLLRERDLTDRIDQEIG